MTDYSAIIRDHLIKQKAQSVKGPNCAYRAPNGNKCAVGCLIPDEKYKETLEGIGLGSLCSGEEPNMFQASVIKILPEDLDLQLAAKWQKYHDARFCRFSYQDWIDGDESHSPQAFYEHLEDSK